MQEWWAAQKPYLKYRAKRKIVAGAFAALGAAFEFASRHTSRIREEVASWPEGWTFTLGVLPDGPVIAVRKVGDGLKYLGREARDDAELKLWFKNLDAFLLTFIGVVPAYLSLTQHRAILHGSIADAMQVVRVMNWLQVYLLPAFMYKRNFKRPPQLRPGELWDKARMLVGILPALSVSLWK